MLRKINSRLSLAAAILFLFHAGLMSLLLSGVIPYMPWYKITGRGLLVAFIAHAALSMFIFFTNLQDNHKGTLYVKHNRSTMLQRILAIVMLFMAFIHIQNGAALWGYQVLYIAVASTHISLSLPRALLTAGAVGSEQTYNKLHILSIILGIIITAGAAVSYGIYAMTGR